MTLCIQNQLTVPNAPFQRPASCQKLAESITFAPEAMKIADSRPPASSAVEAAAVVSN